MEREKKYQGISRILVFLFLVLPISMGLLAAWSAEAKSKPIKLVYSTLLNEGHPMAIANRWFMEQIEKETGGKVKFDKFYSSSLTPGMQALFALRDASIDMTDLCAPYWPNQVPISDLFGVPFITNNGWARAKAANDIILNNPDVRNEYEKNGAHFVAVNASEAVVFSSAKPISTMEDLKGLKARSYGQYAKLLKKLGVFPVSLTWGDIYTSAERGLINACCPTPFIQHGTSSNYEVLPYHYDIGWGTFTIKALAFSTHCWNKKLPQDVKDIITRLGKKWTDVTAKTTNDQIVVTTKRIVKEKPIAEFHVLTPKQREEWVKPIQFDAYMEDWLNKLTEKGISARPIWNEYLKKIAEYEKKADFETTWEIWEKLGVAKPL